MSQKDEAIVDMGDVSLVHIQRQFQLAFKKFSAFFPDGFCVSFRAFDDDDEIISVTAVREVGFPLTILLDGNRCPAFNTGVSSVTNAFKGVVGSEVQTTGNVR